MISKANFSDDFKRDAVAQITKRGYPVAAVPRRNREHVIGRTVVPSHQRPIVMRASASSWRVDGHQPTVEHMNRAERRRERKWHRTGAAGREDITEQFNKAVAQWRAGKIDSARRLCARILQRHPDFANAINLEGILFIEEARYIEALNRFSEALRRAPDNLSYRLNHADALQAAKRLDEAEAAYSGILAVAPDDPGAHSGMGRIEITRGFTDAAIGHFNRALENSPATEKAVLGIVRALGQQGKIDEAIAHIRRAVQTNPALSTKQDEMFAALKAGQDQQIPVWHISMLADEARNAVYQQAIERMVKPGDRVLDIGTGSGLLALMAARAGAVRVTACELSAPVAEAARRVIAENGYSDRIDIVAKPSTALRIGEDMAERADMLVSEILDSGLTGEGVVKFVRHAKRELLTSNARILPRNATVKATLITLPRLRPVNPLGSICGFDLSAFGRFQSMQDYQSIDLRRESHTRLSDIFEAQSFDFYNLPPEASPASPLRLSLDVAAIADGFFHAIAFWFDLSLDDQIAVSSGPEGEVVHWGQAVQFFESEMRVQSGDIVRLTMYFDEMKVRWAVDEIVAR